MEIQHQAFGSRGAFFVEQDGDIAAEMTYMRATEGRIVIDHTAVSDALGGARASGAIWCARPSSTPASTI